MNTAANDDECSWVSGEHANFFSLVEDPAAINGDYFLFKVLGQQQHGELDFQRHYKVVILVMSYFEFSFANYLVTQFLIERNCACISRMHAQEQSSGIVMLRVIQCFLH